jgi:hypothetical protein
MSVNVSLPANKRKALSAMLQGASTEAAAAAAGVTERTVYRWQHESDFKAALAAARSTAMQQTFNMLIALGAKAAQQLEAALDDRATAEQRRAADSVIKHILALQQALDFEERLENIEQQLEELDNGPT